MSYFRRSMFRQRLDPIFVKLRRRIPLIAVTFFLFFWASVLQLRWIDRQKPLASTLVFVEVLAFALYSVIFLLGQAAWISPAFESCAYTLFDTGVKLVHSLVVLTMRWTTEVWSFHTVLRNHVDLLVETRGLVRSHVDVLLQCRRSRAGLVITGSHPFLEHGVGKDRREMTMPLQWTNGCYPSLNTLQSQNISIR
eukprot:109685-Amphidinium_carterae.1